MNYRIVVLPKAASPGFNFSAAVLSRSLCSFPFIKPVLLLNPSSKPTLFFVRYAILVAMHAYGLGGKPLGSVAKFTELCREVLGPEAMPEDGKWEESRDRWHHSELQLSSNSIH